MTSRNESGLTRGAIAIIAIIILAMAVQGIGTFYFSRHFVPGTTINGIDASGLTTEEFEKAAEKYLSSWTIAAQGDGVDLTLSATDINLTLDAPALAAQARSSVSAGQWILDLLHPNEIEIAGVTTLDFEAVLNASTVVAEAVNETAADPTNAQAVYNAETDSFQIADDALGTKIDPTLVAQKIEADALLLKTSSILGEDQLLRPAIAKDDSTLVMLSERANQILDMQIPLNSVATGETLETVSRDLLKGWIAVAGTNASDMQITIDTEGIEWWANETLAERAAHSSEVYDWVLDAPALAVEVTDAINNLRTDAIAIPELVAEERPAESEGVAEQGRHVDVNLTTQYARFYDSDGSVFWRTYFVSGAVAQGRGTPTGTYYVNSKMTNQTLIGADEDEDGEPDYRTPVDYWMPFIGNSVGFHDANWRSQFGGKIYYYNGSHGCINLPPDKAAELFGLIQVGDKVVVHW